ncbi:MAG TPA: class I adenylate-forming enzyme family protein [Myxococcaceae bacterium]
MSRSPFAFDWVLERAERAPGAPCLGTPSDQVSYGQLADRVRAFASTLQGRGVRAGDRVLIALPNSPAAVVASLAAQWLGASAVEVSREWGEAALHQIATQARARVAVVLGRDAAAWGRASAVERFFAVHSAPIPERMAAAFGRPAEWLREDGTLESPPGAGPPAVREASAPALIVYTSGSTGAPRGVIQTHRNVAANTVAICEYLELTESDRAMAILPLFYCYGKSVLQTHLRAGGSVFFDHRFMYPRVVLEALGEQRCTGFAGVPLTFELIRRQIDPGALDLRSLRYVTQAGGAMHPETVRWARHAFRPARLFVMYGQTEATARLSYLPPERAEDKEGSIGRGVRNVELKVVREDGGEAVVGEEGHLVARGESVTPGYFEAPEESAQVLRGGWLWTGDLARRDADGFLFLTGRAKEMLKLGGHRVSPVEIEQALGSHPEVAEAAVVGMPDEVGGERACAVVVRRPDGAVTDAELKRHCRERLPAFKVPKTIAFAAELPRTPAGKVARPELKGFFPSEAGS